MIDPKLIEEIVQAWNDDQDHPRRHQIKRKLPSNEVIQKFVDAAFFASLKQEEGKSVTFSAVLVSETEALSHEELHGGIQIFEEPIAFTASSIAKIAPAFDPNLNSLAVAADASDNLSAWGIFSLPPPKHRFNELAVGIAGIAGIPGMAPDFFTLAAVSPGSLLFSRSYSALGRISSGYFVRSTPTPFTHLSLGKYLDGFFHKTPVWSDDRVSHWLQARDAMEVLLNEIARRGHGGTLVVLDSSAPPPSHLYKANHAFKADYQLGERLKRCMQDHVFDRIQIAYRKVAFEALQRVAQLAAIDGALIIDSNFNILAFGAKLGAPPWTKKTLIGPDGWGNSSGADFDVARYGTRHQSARDFAGAYGPAIVFVVSQDGPVRAFHRTDPKTVTCWLDCTTSMFVR